MRARILAGLLGLLLAAPAWAVPGDLCFEGFTGTKQVYTIGIRNDGAAQSCCNPAGSCGEIYNLHDEDSCCHLVYSACCNLDCCPWQVYVDCNSCAHNACLSGAPPPDVCCADCYILPSCPQNIYTDCRLVNSFRQAPIAAFVTEAAPCIDSAALGQAREPESCQGKAWLLWAVLRDPDPEYLVIFGPIAP